ncbi:MAG: hypothetical protein MUE96_10220 [Bacteroidia bacterium]|jgi:hypothetical protein|nr:hypothetical protein [Bacteroidia bacterium]
MSITLLLSAQQAPNTRTKTITLINPTDTLTLDSLPIIRGSLSIKTPEGKLIEGNDYEVNYLSKKLYFKTIASGTQLFIQYNVLLLDLSKPLQHKSIELIQPEFKENRNPFLYTQTNNSQLFSNDGLKMNGSLSRGLSFGNNQDIVVNSNLNLQLAGKLNNDIDVLAAISDDNNPIQPEGNTQQLQDFDRVYIQLSKNNTKLTVGDFEMAKPQNSYFMNYFKKSRGLQLNTAYDIQQKGTLKFDFDGALSRGRFARNTINGIEGNQGPYRLSGVNGELYIIVISGTEAVYLDGERLKRGEQNDYVIDYNTGELTFMPKRIITQYSRIVVEFQYSDRNYARSVFHSQLAYETQKYKLRLNYFAEQDSKNQPFLQELSDSNKAILAAVGDRVNEAFAPTEKATNTFSASKILYRKIDSLGFAGIFVLATAANQDSVFYEVQFNNVGQGNGDYIQAQSGANGRVFQWVAPINGIRQGNHAPVTLLISPKSMHMLTVGADILAIRNTDITVEIAQSRNDKNLYSTLDKGNDLGYGFRVAMNNTIKLEQHSSNYWHIVTQTQYEFVDKQFRYVERYRNVEFDRIWNRQLTNTNNQDTGFQEHIVSVRANLQKQSIGKTYYQFGYYQKDQFFSGYQQLAGTQTTLGKNRLIAEAEWLQTQDNNAIVKQRNQVSRYKADASREIYNIVAGLRYNREQSNFKKNTDSLQLGSFLFQEYSAYFSQKDSTRFRYGGNYTHREDFMPISERYQSATIAKSVSGNIEFVQQNFNRLSANATFREFEVKDTAFTKLSPERTLASRIEYDYSFVKRVFTANTYYQIGSGQELRRDFQYIEVAAGQGVYVWRDFNGDGLQQLNEFLLASFADKNQANFIRVFLPSNTLVRTNSNQFNQTLNINPAIVWNNRKGVLKFIARWSNQTAVKLDRKTSGLNTLDFINPFLLNIADTALISLASVVRNTLFFNRTNPTFGFDINYLDNRSKSFLTNGFDSRNRQEQGINTRWNINAVWGITWNYTFGTRNYSSDFFTQNNYAYQFYETKPKLIYQATRNLRATLLAGYFEGNNSAEFGNQRGSNREIGGELRYNVGKQGVLNARLSSYTVQFNGDIASPLGYDMLQGFTIGENRLWNVNYQQRLGTNLQITLNYDGRQSQGQPIIHVGRMEARYLF